MLVTVGLILGDMIFNKSANRVSSWLSVLGGLVARWETHEGGRDSTTHIKDLSFTCIGEYFSGFFSCFILGVSDGNCFAVPSVGQNCARSVK